MHPQPTPEKFNHIDVPTISQLVNREHWQQFMAERHGIGSVALSNIGEPFRANGLVPEQAIIAAMGLLYRTKEDDPDASAVLARIDELEELLKTPDESGDSEEVRVDRARSEILNNPTVRGLIGRKELDDAHRKLLEVWPHFKKYFRIGVHRGIKLGYIPSVVGERLDQALQKTSVRVADSAVIDIMTDIDTLAYYRSVEDEVGIAHNSEERGGDFETDLVHEFTHKLSGGTFKSEKESEDEDQNKRPRVGFGTVIENKGVLRSETNEAITHHITLGIKTGDFETVDPDKRADGDTMYYAYRKILGTFLDNSLGVIDLKTLTSAYFEDTGPGGSTFARRRFAREVRKTYGKGALSKLDTLFKLSNKVSDQHLDKVVLSRIHPPKLDDHGKVLVEGGIDTDSRLPTYSELNPDKTA